MMARFTIVSRLLVTNSPHVEGQADSASDAYKLAQNLTSAGKRDVRIGDEQTKRHFDVSSFAQEYKLL
jgi:hypothetical protein